MIGTDLLSQDSAGALTRPTVSLDFSGGGGGGGLGGLASAVGLGGGGGPALADGLVSLRLVRGMAPDIDWAEMLLAPVPGGPDLPAAGDAGSIALTAGDQSAAFACVIDMADQRADGLTRLTASNGGRLLSRARVNLSFAEQDPGAIIDALAAEAGADSAIGSAGETLSSFIADDRRTAWDHVARLALTAGRLAGFDDAGALTLYDDTAGGEAVARFAVGESLIDHRIQSREAAVGALTVDADGSADQGGNAWAWLRKDKSPVSATVGSGQPARRLPAPWLRGQPAAQTLADTRLRALNRTVTWGRFVVQAAPQVTPGSLIEIAGTASDGMWLVLRVTLRFNLRAGMISEIEAAPAGGGGP